MTRTFLLPWWFVLIMWILAHNCYLVLSLLETKGWITFRTFFFLRRNEEWALWVFMFTFLGFMGEGNIIQHLWARHIWRVKHWLHMCTQRLNLNKWHFWSVMGQLSLVGPSWTLKRAFIWGSSQSGFFVFLKKVEISGHYLINHFQLNFY